MPRIVGDDASILIVRTRFEAMATRPGGVPRESAIETANASLTEMKPDFIEWLDRELALLTEAVPGELKAVTVTIDDAWIHGAYVHCRSIRDVGATMGFEMITFIANGLCELIEAVRAGIECPGETIEAHVRALTLAKREASRGLGAKVQPPS
jgi:hypothetical protein